MNIKQMLITIMTGSIITISSYGKYYPHLSAIFPDNALLVAECERNPRARIFKGDTEIACDRLEEHVKRFMKEDIIGVNCSVESYRNKEDIRTILADYPLNIQDKVCNDFSSMLKKEELFYKARKKREKRKYGKI